jgi:hypothetical protein
MLKKIKMKKQYNSRIFSLVFVRFSLILASCILIFSCGSSDGDEKAEKKIEKSIDSSNVAIGVGGKVFIIPSPIETAMLIQKSGAKYDKSLLNSSAKVNSYSTKFQKCLNLGVFGADLGYTTLYDQTQDALIYFKAMNTLATDLGLSNAFDENLIEHFQKNIGKKDSILILVSSAYRASNDFLKNNDRNEEAALIIAGGWIETLQFTINIIKIKENEELKRRIAEQKITLNNLISLLSSYQGSDEYAELLKKLNDLKSEYNKVEYKYVYVPPITDEENKITAVKSKSESTITPEILKAIGDKVTEIRGLIVA